MATDTSEIYYDPYDFEIDDGLRLETGEMPELDMTKYDNELDVFGGYLDWRVDNPSDDLMTALIQAEFEDHTGTVRNHLSFGYGIHFCLGAALARLEAQVALDEVLNRFPDFTVDMSRAVRARTSTVRGWDSLPMVVG